MKKTARLATYLSVALVCGVVGWVPRSACAQAEGDEAALQHAYDDMLHDLSDPDKSQHYADLADKSGRFRDAAVALERVLRLRPDAELVRLQLGYVYFRLGSYGLARENIRAALASGQLPDKTADEARATLAEAESRLAMNTLSALVYVGARYDSNVVQSPLSNSAAVAAATHKSDIAFLYGGNLSHAYRFGPPDELDTNVAVYGTIQKTQSNFNIAYATADSGPSLALGYIGQQRLALRPFATVSNFAYGNAEYFWGGGPGATVTLATLTGSHLDLTGLVQFRRFYSSTVRPTAFGQTDTYSTLVASYTAVLDDRQTLSLSLGGGLDDARAGSLSSKQVIGQLGYNLSFAAPFSLAGLPWTIGLVETYLGSRFREPDPTVDPTRTRHDNRSDVIASLTIPATQSLSFIASFEYLFNGSNIALFEYDNKAAFLTTNFRF